ncbi:demethylspheroidene O-methyltransferase [Rhodoligotrophos appendicifer]|uniref:methyltransferase n=1 Tax=Rhodoligotrophos appendicifer TaxID=987056 RepID=UPI0011865EB3|nr:methyltransferase [Rhodoligotrophos appendicifer]
MLSAWLEKLRDFRNRKVSDPDFRRWAARFPLTRPIARRQAKALFDLTAGFVYSQILSSCVQVGLFDILARGPRDLDLIAVLTRLPREGAERLLKAAAALDLVEARRGGLYGLGSLGAALVGNPGVCALIRHHDILYGDLADPLPLLQGEVKSGLRHYWAYADDRSGNGATPRRHADYTALMAASQAMVKEEILNAYPIGRHRRLMDVGGGDGTFLIAAARMAPQLKLVLFDLPPVAATAQIRLQAAGLAARAKAVGGDFFTDDLPEGADLVLLNRVLHDHDDDAALAILRAVRKAIAPQGTLLIAEPMAGTPGAQASGDAYFGFYLLAMGQGRPRTAEDIGGLLDQAGFDGMRSIGTNTPLIARLLSARPMDG